MSQYLRGSTLAGALLTAAGCASYPTTSAGEDRSLNLQGYDPVAYFVAERPTEGSAKWKANYEGVTYRFASEAHRDLFRADPVKYAPQYGGWCAQGVSYAVKLGSDPHWFRIVDGKLYIYGDREAYDFVGMDLKGHIARADQYWPEMKDTSWQLQYLKRVVFNRVPHWKDSEELECTWLKRHPDKPHDMFRGRGLDCKAYGVRHGE